jgi:beta-glucanase (GH16 family)
MEGSSARHVVFPFDLTAGFHVYAFEWNADGVIWYVDGKEIHRTNRTAHRPFFVRLGLYEKSNDWAGAIDPKQPYPKDYDIDYVRVYRKAT